jgi:RHS repeat-associated protein
MPMKAIVTNMGGRIVAEERGGTRRLMQHDAMGNVISLINDAGVVTDTYEYWSYGEIRTQTGSSTNPWKFGGAWGYYTDATGRQYVRARTLRNDLGRWITVDPLWPSEPAYGYAGNSPLVNVDPSGKRLREGSGCGGKVGQCCDMLAKMTTEQHATFMKCMRKKGHRYLLNELLNKLLDSCSATVGPKVCIKCGNSEATPGCKHHPCARPVNGTMVCTTLGDTFPIWPPGNKCRPGPGNCPDACGPGTGCDCAIHICDTSAFEHGLVCDHVFHEMAHCFGFMHGLPIKDGEGPPDIVYDLGRCLCMALFGDKCIHS